MVRGLDRSPLALPDYSVACTASRVSRVGESAVKIAILNYCKKQGMTEKQIAVVEKACHDPLRVHISSGNRKIGNTANFSLLPGFTCSFWASCTCCNRKGCYALKENRYTAVLYNRVQNTIIAVCKPEMIIAEMAAYIMLNHVTLVRLHEAGDFVTDHYLKAILSVASMFPAVRFYTYTKQYERILKNAASVQALKNVEIKISTWTGLPARAKNLIAALIGKGFSTASLLGDEYSGNCSACLNQVDGRTCNDCMLCMVPGNIGFKKH